jgi:ELWxxDGT repeat protein
MSSRSFPLLAALSFLLAPALDAAELTPRLVKDIDVYPQPASSAPSVYVTAGGVTFFNASDGDGHAGLWRTDGTASGTYPLAPSATYFAANDRSYFFNQGSSELWVSGGTAATTMRLAGWPVTQSTSYDQRCWVASLGLLFFTASDGAHGQELWRSDGTAGGTDLLEDLRPGPESSRPRDMVAFGGSL